MGYLKSIKVAQVFIGKYSQMSIYRSYFGKNNTLIEGNQTNNSQNPVTEISYGSPEKLKTRFIFKGDFDNLYSNLISNGVAIENIISHKLHLTNTIAYRPDLLGKKSYLEIIDRAMSFDLDLFMIPQDWDEGGGYNFVYKDQRIIEFDIVTGASNWYQRTTNQPWIVPGAYIGLSGSTGSTGTTYIIGTQHFEKGNEDLNIDVTDYVNQILYSGSTDYGLGLKFSDFFESIDTNFRQAVGFHAKNTNTVFEPYIETIINDEIRDDRKFFYMDKVNELYLYSSMGDVFVSAVTITDYEGKTIATLSGNSITRVKRGVYKINYSVNSSTYPDAVIFNDNWHITQNGKNKTITQDFYLISSDVYYNFDLNDQINPDNFYFSYYGLKSGEVIKRGDVRRIQITTKQLYQTQDNNLPLDIQYRLYLTQGGHSQTDIIPFTSVNRTVKGYEFDLDTSWLIPHDYHLELKLSNGSTFATKSPIKFTITNDDIFAN